LAGIQERLLERDLLPTTQVVDCGYVTGQTIAKSAALGVELLGPVQPDSSPQARRANEGSLPLARFEVNYECRQVRCPGGAVSQSWHEVVEKKRGPAIHVRFAARDCASCALRSLCLSPDKRAPTGRTLKLGPYS